MTKLNNNISPEEAEDYFKKIKQEGITDLHLDLKWQSVIHKEDGVYNEAYLASLRKILLIAEKEGVFVYIEPCHDELNPWTEDAYNHAQRRLKNLKAISGWGAINGKP